MKITTVSETPIKKNVHQVDAYSLVESPKDIVHCIYNNTNSIVRILVVKAPRPKTATKVL
jgi:hypothetical protein